MDDERQRVEEELRHERKRTVELLEEVDRLQQIRDSLEKQLAEEKEQRALDHGFRAASDFDQLEAMKVEVADAIASKANAESKAAFNMKQWQRAEADLREALAESKSLKELREVDKEDRDNLKERLDSAQLALSNCMAKDTGEAPRVFDSETALIRLTEMEARINSMEEKVSDIHLRQKYGGDYDPTAA